ncbi:MAG: UDP-N-acetylglucosamine--N-acetylmuramyl-(pentapeptide) pyrophosphoryl-undecaprenol N-acetylglucosamine transferase, partial [Anaerolineaceae bacterium]|nr:UDP-N-acetylglucosamine--N-acetylmuramyl-(pentapeptide) pyrophosphoryl-undecaprenol N-acetylglucosamine transferase [Anaerolineaceae bacterium]
YKLIRGVIKSAQILKQYQPDVIFYTGGYLAAPMAIAGFKKPSVLYVPDIEPGIALKFIAKFAHAIALTTENSKKYFNQTKNLVVTGYPLRKELSRYSKVEARKVFNFQNDLPVILIYGGSKGAHTINQVIKKNLEILLAKTQIIHVTGNYDWEDMQQVYSELPAELSKNYRIYPYIHEEMSAAFSCADLCVCRGGASTLGELPFFGLPAIVVPYPYAWRYQKINAQFLVDHKAAIMLPDEEMDHRLTQEISLLLDSPKILSQMSSEMQFLSTPDAAQQIGNLITEQFNLASQKGGYV